MTTLADIRDSLLSEPTASKPGSAGGDRGDRLYPDPEAFEAREQDRLAAHERPRTQARPRSEQGLFGIGN